MAEDLSSYVERRRTAADLNRTVLLILFILALLGAAVWVLLPFILAAIWASTIVISSWPLLRRLEGRLGGRRWAAVTVMTLALLLLLVVPLGLAVYTIVTHVDLVLAATKDFAEFRPGPAPAWAAGLPLIGPYLVTAWDSLREGGAPALLEMVSPYVGIATKWFAAQVGNVGLLIVQFLLTVVLAALMYGGGEGAAVFLRRFARRLAADRGDRVITLAGQSIRAVALGVGVTAVIQAGLGGIGLWLAGVPVAGLLAAVMLLLCVAQLGPLLVLLPATAWVFWTGATGWGVFLLVWSLVVGTVDNFVRPVLIRRGADLPLLLILGGVIGGLIAFGLVGIFVGPVVLAVTWTLLNEWLAEGERQAPAA